MTSLSSTLVAAVSNGSTVLGAPVLEIQASVVSNYVPPAASATATTTPATTVVPGKASNIVVPISAFIIAVATILF